jgi:hypothetical protein
VDLPKVFNSDQPWMLISMAIVVVVVAIVGGIVTITDPGTLTFEEYLDKLLWLAGAVAVFGGARKVGDAIDSNKTKKVEVEVENQPAPHPVYATPGTSGNSASTVTLRSVRDDEYDEEAVLDETYEEPEYDPRYDTDLTHPDDDLDIDMEPNEELDNELDEAERDRR